jgi:uncharacterized membrane protein HdeD (DUF308 family)
MTAGDFAGARQNEGSQTKDEVQTIIFGAALVANPAAGALAVVWIISAYAFIFSLMIIALAFRLRGLSGRLAKCA